MTDNTKYSLLVNDTYETKDETIINFVKNDDNKELDYSNYYYVEPKNNENNKFKNNKIFTYLLLILIVLIFIVAIIVTINVVKYYQK
jgi:hypothetical protein